MDNQTLWGVLLGLYVVPFGLWHLAKYWAMDASGRTSKKADRLTMAWCAGLVILLIAAKSEFPAWRLAVAAIFATPCVLIAFILPKDLTRRKDFRLLLSGSVFWALCVLSWYLVFGHSSYTTTDEFLLIALIPPVLACVALLLWRWASRGA